MQFYSRKGNESQQVNFQQYKNDSDQAIFITEKEFTYVQIFKEE